MTNTGVVEMRLSKIKSQFWSSFNTKKSQ